MVIWLFENQHFANAWIPFDRKNQKRLEYIYRHNQALIDRIKHNKESEIRVEEEEEDDSIYKDILLDNNFLSISLVDSHFEQPIIIYPTLMFASLPDREMLLVRIEKTLDYEKINL